jgi:hypothetical protein
MGWREPLAANDSRVALKLLEMVKLAESGRPEFRGATEREAMIGSIAPSRGANPRQGKTDFPFLRQRYTLRPCSQSLTNSPSSRS